MKQIIYYHIEQYTCFDINFIIIHSIGYVN